MNSIKVIFCFVFMFTFQLRFYEGTIDWVIDANTFMLKMKNDRLKVTLVGIECPENDQLFGKEARLFMEKYWKKPCRVMWKEKDQYDRVLGTLWVDGVNINLQLVKEGLAWRNKNSKDTTLLNAEAEARAKKVGLWADGEAVAP